MLSGKQHIETGQSLPLAAVARGLRKIALLPVLLFDVPVCSFSRKISVAERQEIAGMLETGDILLTTDKVFPIWRLAVSIFGSPCYSHAAIYRGDDTVVEATTFHPSGSGVAHTGLDDFLSGRKKVCVIRPAYGSQYQKNDMLQWVGQQVGKPYDYLFRREDTNAMYCAKLVAKAMSAAGFLIESKRLLKHELYVPDIFIRTAGMTVVYRDPGTIGGRIVSCLPFLIAVGVFFTVSGAWLTGIYALLIVVGWLQHLKRI